MLGAVLLNFANVVGRYLFRSPFVWAEEITNFLALARLSPGDITGILRRLESTGQPLPRRYSVP